MTLPEPSTNPKDREANLDLVEQLPLEVREVDFATLVASSVASYNSKHAEAIKNGTKLPATTSPKSARAVTALKKQVLRDILTRHTNYQELRNLFRNMPGRQDACDLIHIQMLDEIAATYSGLSDVAEEEIQFKISQLDERDAARDELLQSVSDLDRPVVEDALSQDISIDFMPYHKLIQSTLIEYALGNPERRLTANHTDPNNKALLEQECMHYIIRTLTNNDTLCLSYRGLPGYATAWNIIYEKSLDTVAGVYPTLRPIVEHHRKQAGRPWSSYTIDIPWKRADGPAGTFVFNVDKTAPHLLPEMAQDLGMNSDKPSLVSAALTCLTNFDQIKPAIHPNEGYKPKSSRVRIDRTAHLKVKIEALQLFKKLYPEFAQQVNQRINDHKKALK